jgi:GNAT superfamily N-acetyltransferase
MEQEYDYHIWTEQSPISINDILLANTMTHKLELTPQAFNTFKEKVINAFWGPTVLAYVTPKNEPLNICGAVTYGVYEMIMNNEIVKGGIAYSNFVRPDHQGRGIFKKLIRFVKDECKKRGFVFLISFPNSNSVAGYRSVGWNVPDGYLKFLIRPASFSKLLLRIWRYKDLRKKFEATKPERNLSYIKESLKGIEELNILKKTDSIGNFVYPNRSQEFYFWRLCDLNQSSYGVELKNGDFIIYRRGSRGILKEIQLLDYRFNSKKDFSRLLKSIEAKENADIFTLRISRDHPYFYQFRKNFFFNTGKSKDLNFAYSILEEVNKETKFTWAISGLDLHMA